MSATKSLALALLLAACTAPVDPQSSGVEAPSLWQRLQGEDAPAALTGSKDAAIEQQWWKQFNDPVLDQLVGDALANNKSLAIAKARIEEARANRVGTRSRLLPQISGAAQATRQNPGALFGDTPYSMQQAQLDTAWEIDLFGKNQARTAQATALLESEEATAQGVRVSLLAELARTYFELREAALQIGITQENITAQQRTFSITQAQFEGAFVSRLDVERAGTQLAITQAQLPLWQAQRDAARNRLNVLLGKPPGGVDALLADAAPQPALPEQIVIAAPAQVLANRPDVRAAERQFAAAVAGADAATRELFPTISLSAFFGVQNFNDLSAKPWGVGANLTQPILNFGRIEAGIDAANAREQQAFLTYQQTVLEALADMETALSRYLNEGQRNRALAEATTRSNASLTLARRQYREGESALLDLLIVERDALAAESAQATSDAALRQQLVAIYAAAGGGWADPATP
jgi:NodT family efflux transporter outer membrane factor (OMF) lipoprotein